MSDIELYITGFNPEVQRRLMEIRITAFNAFKDANEKIYHGMPTFMIANKNIMNYGAYKNHISICLGYDWKDNWRNRAQDLVDYLKKHNPQYHFSKYTIQFSHKDSFPNELIKEICKMLWHDRNYNAEDIL